jgi:hypothetical protein
MSNLLEETRSLIEEYGHTPADIVFIGSAESGHRCSWAQFEILANREYDDGFGAQEVAMDLEIWFGDGASMRRGEYDGSEWWDYSGPLIPPENTPQIESLFVPDNRVGWVTLAEIHKVSDPD